MIAPAAPVASTVPRPSRTSPTSFPPPGSAVAGGPSTPPPPFVLPGEHFAAGLCFLVLGGLGLAAAAPLLAAGSYPAMRVVAVAHLFTLGWITSSIMGALYQFLPVALGESIASVRLAHATFALWVPGLLLFVGGLGLGVQPAMLAGAAVFGTAVLLFCANLGVTLFRAQRRDVTWWALAFAAFFLLVTLVLGLALAGNLRWGYLGANRLTAVGTHLHVALAGWVLLVMVGVADRLVPMFLLSHGADRRPARFAVGLVASGAAVLAFLHHGPPLVARWLPALLIAGGLACFILQAALYYRHRHRPALDPGMRLAAAALALLAFALVPAGAVVMGVAGPRVTTAYVMTAVLAISLFVAAHYYKIVPFLVWYHRFGPLAGRRPIPRVTELYSTRVALAAGACLVAGALVLILAVAAGSAVLALSGAVLFTGGAVTEAVQMLAIARRRPE